MAKLKQIFLFIVIIIPISQSSTNCNDNCLTTTYYLATDGTNECSSKAQCAAQVSFKASQVKGNNYLTINLIGYKVILQETVSLSLVANGIENVYSCNLISILGDTVASVTIEGKTIRNGSSVHLDGNLHCSWIMSIEDQVWPHFMGKPIDLTNDDKCSIVLARSDISLTVAPHTNQLTIFRMKFLKCCHQVYGNDQYQLVVEPSHDSTTLQLQSIGVKPLVLTLNLVSYNNDKLIFNCFPQSYLFMAYAKIENQLYSITDQLGSLRVNPPFICSWRLPLTFKGSTELIYHLNQVYGAQIYADNQIVYSKDQIGITSFSFKSLSSSLTLIFVTIFIVNNII